MFEIQEAVAALCGELALDPPPAEAGVYQIRLETLTIEIASDRERGVLLISPLGSPVEIAERRREAVANVLRQVIQINGGRVHALARSEVMAYDGAKTRLILWRSLNPMRDSVRDFLEAAESLLNESEFWNTRLGAAA